MLGSSGMQELKGGRGPILVPVQVPEPAVHAKRVAAEKVLIRKPHRVHAPAPVF